MAKPKGLYKTTIVIWSDFDPREYELTDLGWEATNGDAYCDTQSTDYVTKAKEFPQTEMFDSPEDEG